MAKRRRTEIARIADPAARLVTHSKRRKGLFNKTSGRCRPAAPTPRRSSSHPPENPALSATHRQMKLYLTTSAAAAGGGCGDGYGKGEVMPPMDLTQWAEWVQTKWDACSTKEDLESLIPKCEAVRDYACEKLKALEDDSRVMAAMVFGFAGGPGRRQRKFGGGAHPASSDLGDCGFDPDDFLNLLEDFDGHGDGFLTSPEDLADGNGSLAVEPSPVPSDLGDYGFDLEDFLNLFEDLMATAMVY
ncbi:hypothetical protein NL676_030359 [Syzygium grande]|nr:hypothetical protein NL676_030359 [Syzygium grande]